MPNNELTKLTKAINEKFDRSLTNSDVSYYIGEDLANQYIKKKQVVICRTLEDRVYVDLKENSFWNNCDDEVEWFYLWENDELFEVELTFKRIK